MNLFIPLPRLLLKEKKKGEKLECHVNIKMILLQAN